MNIVLSDIDDREPEFIPLITDEDEKSNSKIDIPDILPILPLRNTVLFPGVVIPITVGRDKSINLIKDTYKKTKIVGIVSQKDVNIEEPKFKDLHTIGTVAHIIKVLEMPDNNTTVIIQGEKRFKIKELITDKPFFKARIETIEDIIPKVKTKDFEAIVSSLKDLSLKIIKLSMNIPPEASFAVKNIENAPFLINFICSNTDIKTEEKQKLLEINDLKERSILLLEYLTREVQMLELKNDIQSKVKTDLDKQQKEFLLHQQMKTIQSELGQDPLNREIENGKKKAEEKKWPKECAETVKKVVEKLHRIHPVSGEYSVQLNYLQVLLELPWLKYTKDNFNLEHAQKVLDEDHYGLEKVKDRILEHLAVLKIKGDLKSPLLCLYGPPGVGKTSLGKSIARALSRKYVRMSLGGLHDEAEIRGHRKTYIGAMPGRIIQNIKKAKSSNPVFVLDEIDKIGQDFRGDPAFALLEVLDPEQNNAFHDNYLELDYDLSKVMFITTANITNTINPALLDRMELINVSGYIVEEKVEIAKRHLIPKQLEAHGVKKRQVTFTDKVLDNIIENYTRESGVREMEKKIAKIIRRIAKKIAFNIEYNKNLTNDDVKEILGPTEYFKDIYQGNDLAGVATGLAWTSVGGEILYIETSLSKGKGNLTLTGNLGEVMKESAKIALEYFKAHTDSFNMPDGVFENWNVHIHVPEGAIPKDGPSAGIAMVTSLASAFTQRKIKKNIAMTGEITLRGKVLPVGGIKEKILAAKRANINEIILSKENRKNIEEINDIYLKDVKFHFVDEVIDVLQTALLKEKVSNPLKIT